jgi:hypothetical protein
MGRTLYWGFVLSFGLSSFAAKAQAFLNEIRNLADDSACTKKMHPPNRGKAPKGLLRGLSLTFARSYCRMQLPNPPSPKEPGTFISQRATGNNLDVMNHYRPEFAKVGLNIDESGLQPLIAQYALAVGFSMQESSGQYCESWDRSANDIPQSVEAEAGLFQSSANSIYSAPFRRLYEEYKNRSASRCFLEDFKVGVKNCTGGEISGEGLAFQKFTKACPAYATEHALMASRIHRDHYGPLKTPKTVKVFAECKDHFQAIATKVSRNLVPNCDALN